MSGDIGLVVAVKFANNSLQSVTNYRISDFPGNGNAKAALIKGVESICDDKIVIVDAFPLSG